MHRVKIVKTIYKDVPIGTVGQVVHYNPDSHNPFPYEIIVPGIRTWLPFKEDEVEPCE